MQTQRLNRDDWWVVAALAYIVGVLVMGSASATPPQLGVRAEDKLWHLVGFAVMQMLNWRALTAVMRGWSGAGASGVALVLTIAVGGALELWQSRLPHRSAEWADAVANTLGASLAAAWQWRVSRQKPRPT